MTQGQDDNISSPRSNPPPSEAPEAARRVPDRADLLDPVPTELVSLTAASGDTPALVARFWNGPHACYGAHARVDETEDEVRISVDVGTLPEAADTPCPAVAELQELVIRLGSALGDRRVIAR